MFLVDITVNDAMAMRELERLRGLFVPCSASRVMRCDRHYLGVT